MADSGTLFAAGTTDDIACIVQCGLQCTDPTLRVLLGAGMVEAGLLPRGDASYDEFAIALARETGGVVAEPIFAEGTLPAPPRPRPKRAATVAERPSAKRKTSAKPKKTVKKSQTKRPRSTKKPTRKRKKPVARRR
jgi:hypothetical protein